MNRGARRAPIFFGHECCSLFHGLLAQLPDRYNVVVHGYAVMPNHFHLLLQTPDANLSRAMHYLCGTYARELNRTHEWDGPLFKGRFKNKVVETTTYWQHLLAYVHLNPVRGGMAVRLDAADWTSHPAYVGLEHPPDWLCRDEMLDIYGSAKSYFEYLKDVQFGRRQAPEGFERSVLWKKRAAKRPEPRTTDMQRGTVEETFDHALAEIESVTGLKRDELLNPARGRKGNRARWVTTWWLRWRDRLSGGETARMLGVSQARISQMLARAREAEGEQEPLSTWMQELRERA